MARSRPLPRSRVEISLKPPELQVLLRRMHTAHGLTSLIATHNMQLAESCDRVLRLEAGRLRPV